ncbi:MAG: hypothetical protein F6K11_10245 [Leptolyngbya sp. SIO3F4]|nr:hypothetical protein [Leptolyngbya sp. SIO3F4]
MANSLTLKRPEDKATKPKYESSNSPSPCDLAKIRATFQGVGIPINSGHISFLVHIQALGKDSPEAKALAKEYEGQEHWFLSDKDGLSQSHLEKVLYKAISTEHFSALAAVLKTLSGQEFKPAPYPDFLKAHTEQLERFDVLRTCLHQGQPKDIGVEDDLWKQSAWTVGRPEYTKAGEFLLHPLNSASPIDEHEVIWTPRMVPVGRAFVFDSKVSVLLDERPYTFTGHQVLVGKKDLLFVGMSRKVKRHIKALTESLVRSNH